MEVEQNETIKEEQNKTTKEEQNKTTEEEENQTTDKEENQTTDKEENKTTDKEENQTTDEEENQTTDEEENQTTDEEENQTTDEEENETTDEEENETIEKEKNKTMEEEQNQTTEKEQNKIAVEEQNETTEVEQNDTMEEEQNQTTDEEHNQTTEEEQNDTMEEEQNQTTDEEHNQTTEEEQNDTMEEEQNQTTDEEQNQTTDEEQNQTTEEEQNDTMEEEQNQTTDEEQNQTADEEQNGISEKDQNETVGKEQNKITVKEQNGTMDKEQNQTTEKEQNKTTDDEQTETTDEEHKKTMKGKKNVKSQRPKKKPCVIYSDTSEEEIIQNSDISDCSEVFEPVSRNIMSKMKQVLDKGASDNSTSDEEPCEMLGPIARDKSYKDIFVKLVHKSSTSAGGKSKKSERVYDSRHPCPFCEKTVSNFSHHIFSKKHCNEKEVLEIDNLEKKERKNEIAKLRLRAAHNHNLQVLKNKKGEMYLLRRTSASQKCNDESDTDEEDLDTFDVSKYGPCPQCFGWILLKSIKRHYKSCAFNSCNFSKSELILQSNILCGQISEVASKSLREEVFPIMEKDEVFKVATNDSLIVTLGNDWMIRNRGNKIMRPYYTSSVMRLAAKLKIAVQKIDNTSKDLVDYFVPEHFSNIVKAALLCCNQNELDEEDLKSPSNAIKLGYDIKRMVGAKLTNGIEYKRDEWKVEAMDFLALMDKKWDLNVTKLARDLLVERSFNRQRKLPLPNDVKKLAAYVKGQLQGLDLKDTSYSNFRRTAILSLVRVTLYNRRRCHEVQGMRLTSYSARKIGVDEVAQEMKGHLTTFEAHLLERQEVVIIRGKKGKGVPVIIPEDANQPLQYLAHQDVRRKAGINNRNPYVFSNSSAGVFRAYDAIRSVTHEEAADLEQPDLIRTSNMRKYMATMLQALDTTDAERQWIVDHMGHTLNIHQIHYRQTSDLLERVDVAKILLIQDFGLVGKYRGKRLQDIQLDDFVEDVLEERPDQAPDETERLDQSLDEAVPIDVPGSGLAIEEDYIPDLMEKEDSDSEEDIRKKRKTKKPYVRQKWTQDEENELRELFKEEFERTLACPGQKRIQKKMGLSQKNNGLIFKRKRDNIKKKISNMLMKLKSKKDFEKS